MAEKIRPLHLPPTSTPSQQPLLVPTSSPDGSAQHGMSVQKPQQVPGHHPQPQGSGQPDIALHARPASSSGPGTVITMLFVGLGTPLGPLYRSQLLLVRCVVKIDCSLIKNAIAWQLPDGNMDDKSAVKAKGLWEDWHMRQLGEQPGRINHRSGTAVSWCLWSAGTGKISAASGVV